MASIFGRPMLGCERVQALIVFSVGDNAWTLDLTSGAGHLSRGTSEDADLTLTMNDDTFQKLVSGKLNPQQVLVLFLLPDSRLSAAPAEGINIAGAAQAFLFRKLKIKGSMAKAMKVSPVLAAARASPAKL